MPQPEETHITEEARVKGIIDSVLQMHGAAELIYYEEIVPALFAALFNPKIIYSVQMIVNKVMEEMRREEQEETK